MFHFSRCGFGIHNYQISDEACIADETWHHKTFNGQKVEGSEYTRSRFVRIEKCSRCGKEKAYRFLTSPRTEDVVLSVDFARAEIARARKGTTNDSV